jgi:hypothetical protein
MSYHLPSPWPIEPARKPTMDEHGNWTTRPAAEIDGDDKRVIRANLRTAVAAGLNLDTYDHPERDA